MNATVTNVNSIDFDYLEWLTTDPSKEEFLAVWNRLSNKERALVLADFEAWQLTNH